MYEMIPKECGFAEGGRKGILGLLASPNHLSLNVMRLFQTSYRPTVVHCLRELISPHIWSVDALKNALSHAALRTNNLPDISDLVSVFAFQPKISVWGDHTQSLLSKLGTRNMTKVMLEEKASVWNLAYFIEMHLHGITDSTATPQAWAELLARLRLMVSFHDVMDRAKDSKQLINDADFSLLMLLWFERCLQQFIADTALTDKISTMTEASQLSIFHIATWVLANASAVKVHDAALLLANANTVIEDTFGGPAGCTLLEEKCVYCDVDVPFTDFRHETCSNGHYLQRCCASLLLLDSASTLSCRYCDQEAMSSILVDDSFMWMRRRNNLPADVNSVSCPLCNVPMLMYDA